MNKYEQLCNSYAKNMKDFRTYKEECYEVAAQLREAIIEYYAVPSDRLRLRSKEDPKILTDNIYAAMDMQKDTFWHVRFAINLQCSEGNVPEENITFEACIKKTINQYILVKLPKETEFTLKRDGEKYDFREFLDFLFFYLKGFYENELERFLTSGQFSKEQAPIGFRFDPIEK